MTAFKSDTATEYALMPNLTIFEYPLNQLPPANHMATATYAHSFLDIGWDVLKIGPSAELLASNPNDAYYAHGYLEGYLTQEMIAQLFYNAGGGFYLDPERDAPTWTYYTYHKERLDMLLEQPAASLNPLQRATQNALRMFVGLVDGYNDRAPEMEQLSWWHLYSVTCQQDIKGLKSDLAKEQQHWQPTSEWSAWLRSRSEARRKLVTTAISSAGGDGGVFSSAKTAKRHGALATRHRAMFEDRRISGLAVSYCRRRPLHREADTTVENVLWFSSEHDWVRPSSSSASHLRHMHGQANTAGLQHEWVTAFGAPPRQATFPAAPINVAVADAGAPPAPTSKTTTTTEKRKSKTLPTGYNNTNNSAFTDPTLSPQTRQRNAQQEGLLHDHCTFVVKVTDDDVIMSHVTWEVYNYMTRIHKTYYLERTITFSAYPGTIHSSDDFILTSNGFAISETTNEWEVYNMVLCNPLTTLVPFRVFGASIAGGSAQEWSEMFLVDTSGTDNADWIVVDMNKYNDAAPSGPNSLDVRLQPGFAYMVEQWPGNYSLYDDITQHLRDATFVVSNNCPYFTIGGPLSGLDKMIFASSYFDCWTASRAVMTMRAAENMRTVQDMMDVMRLNDYLYDPALIIPICDPPEGPKGYCDPSSTPGAAVANRCDLSMPFGVDIGLVGPWIWGSNFGGIDAKVATLKQLKSQGGRQGRQLSNITTYVINGPSCYPHDEEGGPSSRRHRSPLPCITATDLDPPYIGMPEVYDFPWVTVNSGYSTQSVPYVGPQ